MEKSQKGEIKMYIQANYLVILFYINYDHFQVC